ncbi:MAG TPA: nucleoside deaminase [Chitinophagaceae bacterium]|nr:nucleoside deaminase [Chitinophagaceae bacterium]
MESDDEYFMKQALKEAGKALDADEVPVGAVVVIQNKIIGRGYNQVETLNDSTAHAEIIALTSAFNHVGSKYLPDAAIYVTIEPCAMCCGALYWSKIGRLVYGAADSKHGGLAKVALHPKTEIIGNIYAAECAGMMQNFFRKRRI